jgi:hypothetical protein
LEGSTLVLEYSLAKQLASLSIHPLYLMQKNFAYATKQYGQMVESPEGVPTGLRRDRRDGLSVNVVSAAGEAK